LGAWKTFTGQGINRSYVERIQDGKTKKPEILTWFGDPQEVKRTPEGVVFIYQTFRAKQGPPGRYQGNQKPADTPFQLEENLKNQTKQGYLRARNWRAPSPSASSRTGRRCRVTIIRSFEEQRL
jgi:hypothetical protein